MNEKLENILDATGEVLIYVFVGLLAAVFIVGFPLILYYEVFHIDKDIIYEDDETICTHTEDSEFTHCYNKLTNAENCKYHYYYRNDKPPVDSKCYSNNG